VGRFGGFRGTDQAEDLISGMPFEHLLADKGYDANWLRARVAEMGSEAVIPYRQH
jgi:hypothetical protein